MDLDPFLTDLAATLEIEPAELTDSFELVWESILVLTVITLLSRHYGLTLEVDDLMRCKTIGELGRLVRGTRLAA